MLGWGCFVEWDWFCCCFRWNNVLNRIFSWKCPFPCLVCAGIPCTIDPFEWSMAGALTNAVEDVFGITSFDEFPTTASEFCVALDGFSVDKYSVSSASDKLVVRNLWLEPTLIGQSSKSAEDMDAR